METAFRTNLTQIGPIPNGRIDVTLVRPDNVSMIEFEEDNIAKLFEVWWEKKGKDLFEKSMEL